MLPLRFLFWHAILLSSLTTGAPTLISNNGQLPLLRPATSPRKLTGSFLHISDLHPDPFFQPHSDPSQACHHSHGSAGPLGAEKSQCDSPISLVNATFDWLAQHLVDDIDFIVWTGDSARHDNDDAIPRNKSQVLDQNRLLVEKFHEVWGHEQSDQFKIPIVPNLGNNDILPHNIFASGPNEWTSAYLKIWRRLVPEEQRHSFARGGWFYVEVIPDRLAVFSLNTLYFFENNYSADGCDDRDEAGYEQFEWLRIQLQLLRERGVKAILTGHVPPARNDEKEMWSESCWMKYALWLRQYRDVIVGSAWGHMNVEHFFLQDFNDIIWDTASDALLDGDLGDLGDADAQINGQAYELRRRAIHSNDEDDISIAVKPPSYLNALREQWSSLPSNPPSLPIPSKRKKKSPEDRYNDAIGGPHAERFAVSFVSASVVPNFYPTLRLFKYNLTGLEDATAWTASDMSASIHHTDDKTIAEKDEWNIIDAQIQLAELKVSKKKKKKHKKHKKHKGGDKKQKPHFQVPAPPSPSSLPGPAYSQQPLSWTGYVQYFANLTHIQRNLSTSDSEKLRQFKYQVEYDTLDESDVYGLAPTGNEHSGITVRNILELAGRIGSYKPKRGNLLESERVDVDDESDASDAASSEQSNSDSESDADGSSDEDVSTEKKKKRKGKKHKKKRRKIINKSWFAFVDRALVGTVPPEKLNDDFGQVEGDEV